MTVNVKLTPALETDIFRNKVVLTARVEGAVKDTLQPAFTNVVSKLNGYTHVDLAEAPEVFQAVHLVAQKTA